MNISAKSKKQKTKKMAGVIFVIVVPTANFEQEILNGIKIFVLILMINFFVFVYKCCHCAHQTINS